MAFIRTLSGGVEDIFAMNAMTSAAKVVNSFC
jgi:hypothetical protein